MSAPAPKTLKNLLQKEHSWLSYYQKNHLDIPEHKADVICDMLSCGLSVRGRAYHECENPECTHSKFIPFTCKQRFCPSCGMRSTNQWIDRQTARLPTTRYQHMTFTIPSEFWRLIKTEKIISDMAKTAANIINELAAKKGLIVGIFIAIHTFGRDLKWNTHIHLSVTCGGLDKNNQWKSIYFRKDTLMRMWRYRVLKLIRQHYNDGQIALPSSLADFCQHYSFENYLAPFYQKRWIIHLAKPTKDHSSVVNYLGRYIKRPPIAQSKLKHYDGNIVIFTFLNHKNGKYENANMGTDEFIRRFIQHIPDKHARRIRYYGLFANRNVSRLLPLVYKALNLTQKVFHKTSYALQMELAFKLNPLKCILCGSAMRLIDITVGKTAKELRNHMHELASMRPVH